MQTIRQLLLYGILFLPITAWGHSPSCELGWSKNRTIGTNVSYAPDVAINDAGDAVSAFIHFDGTNQRVQASILELFGKHGRNLKHFLSPPGVDAEVPRIAISPKDDDAYVVWKVHSDSQFIVQAATFDTDNKNKSTLTDLTGPVDLGADPIIGVDVEGNALAVWSIFDGSEYHIQSAIHYHRHHHCHKDRWVMLDEIIVDAAFELDLSFDPKGNAILVWEGRIGFKNVIQAATLRSGSKTWVRTADASPSNTQSNSPKVGTDRHGNAIVVWSEGITLDHIAAAKLPFGSSSWINTSNPTSTVASAFPDLAVDPHGNAVAVWLTFTGPAINIEASTLAAGSFTWTDPVILASSLLITDPRVVMDKHGNAVAIWSATGFLQTAFLPLGHSWKTPETLTPSTIGVGGQRIAITPWGFSVITYTAQVFALSEEVVQIVNSEFSNESSH